MLAGPCGPSQPSGLEKGSAPTPAPAAEAHPGQGLASCLTAHVRNPPGAPATASADPLSGLLPPSLQGSHVSTARAVRVGTLQVGLFLTLLGLLGS